MPVIPIHESGQGFSHLDANVPFAIESAVVDGSGNLDITIGAGRIVWGASQYELTSNTIVTQTGSPVADDTYYAIIDFNSGSPQLGITTTPTLSSVEPDWTYLGSVVVAGGVVDSITDLRGFLPPSRGYRAAFGSEGSPAYSFSGDSDTGIYGSSGEIWFTTGGGDEAKIDFDGIKLVDGAVGAPSYAFLSDVDTGLYLQAAGELALAVGGVKQAYFAQSGDERRLYLGGENNDWIGYDPISEVGRLVVNSGESMRWDGNGVDVTGALTVDSLTLNGTTVDSNSTLTLDGAGDIRFEHNGGLRGQFDQSIEAWRWWNGATEMIRFDGNDLRMIGGGQIRAESGGFTGPGYSFDGNTDTGIYESGSSIIFTCDSNVRLVINQSSGDFEFQDDNSNLYCHFHGTGYIGPGSDQVHDIGRDHDAWDNVWAVDFNTVSDASTKDNITDTDLGLEFVRALRPRRFTKNQPGSVRTHYGLVAQEVKQAMDDLGVEDFAGWVDGTANGTAEEPRQGIRYNEIVGGPLIAAIHELADRIEALENA